MKLKVLSLVGIACSLNACATVSRGSHDDVYIDSTPRQADVLAVNTSKDDNDVNCVTPCVMELNRKHSYAVSIEKEGYSPVSTKIFPGLSTGGGTAGAGNVMIGGVIGVIVDSQTGAMNDLQVNPVEAVLNPTGTPSEIVKYPTGKERKAAKAAIKEALGISTEDDS